MDTIQERYAKGSEILRNLLNRTRCEALKPPPILSLSEWANRFAYLSAETSADAGKFKAFAYQNGIMDAVTDPRVLQISMMKGARVGYTKILDHVVGFFIHQDPSPVLIVQPRVEDAEDYSRTEIAPMLRDTPVLAEIAGDLKAKDSNQRILKRTFRNGSSVSFVGANSPGGFRRITARIVAFDEVDGYPAAGAGEEGDQIALGVKRSESFWNRKIILGSTPTTRGVSRIQKAWEESDQRRYHVPCPHCGHKQTLEWANLKWEKNEAGEHLTDTAYFRCIGNGCRIEEHDKLAMIDAGEWIAEKPFNGHAGFHIWSAYSLFPNAAWKNLAKEWLDVYRKPLEKKTFINVTLGEPHEEAIEVTDPEVLRSRCEPYNFETLPSDVKFVTFGADTQDDRIEVTFVGWGPDEEAWVACHEVLPGDTSKTLVWEDFDKLINRPFGTDDGRTLMPQAGCIDSGGHRSEMVYKFCRDRKRRRVYPIIGRGNANQTTPRLIWSKTPTRTKNSGDKPFTVGVDTAKDDMSSRLAIAPSEDGPTARAVHFPAIGLSADYFDQLTSEHAVTRYIGNRPQRKWEPKQAWRRNEAWDCLIYALAARLSLPIKLKSSGERFAPKEPEDELESHVSAPESPEPEQVMPPSRAFRPQRTRWNAYR